ncbi:hypothetical protein QYM36_009928 [Artemia franciscana]|uniref:Uncharacterized protein n=2 Tax=Artemia franciscana TaxID=6661 RepID=A0AA88HVT7_ARTSF|nr:hypothetical protein QYM36_009928 [Artemia franciscana]
MKGPRKGRSKETSNPLEVQKSLLNAYEAANSIREQSLLRTERSLFENGSYMSDSASRARPTRCDGEPGGRLCKTKYNTTAPLYGVSLTSGQPVTIVQKFPDLLQQVIFEVCESKECDILRGDCVQTYVPYLFLVIPLGPVTLTGQDYVLVESGCVCKPKFGSKSNEPNIADALPGFV